MTEAAVWISVPWQLPQHGCKAGGPCGPPAQTDLLSTAGGTSSVKLHHGALFQSAPPVSNRRAPKQQKGNVVENIPPFCLAHHRVVAFRTSKPVAQWGPIHLFQFLFPCGGSKVVVGIQHRPERDPHRATLFKAKASVSVGKNSTQVGHREFLLILEQRSDLCIENEQTERPHEAGHL